MWVIARMTGQKALLAFCKGLIFSFGSTLQLEKQFLKNVKNIFNVYTFEKKIL